MSAPRTALVTGASRGIGRGIALELARQGYALTVSARSEAALTALATELEAAGAPSVTVCAADLAAPEAAAALVASHTAAYDALHALVLCGGVGTAEPLDALTERRLDKTFDVNLRTNLLLVRDSLDLLRAGAAADPHRGARVIGVASITGVFAEPGLTVYGASKAALISMLETLNAEESAGGVMGTAIAPGFVDTDMSAWTADTIAPESMITVDDVVAVVRMLVGLGVTASIPRIVMARSGTAGYVA
ncbi:SDR family NAD(P)-dependent oxidoreductase [Nocardioides hwasunensis]|uniref:SDR family oxidoreductase n=1 Tax=Nocardioides hwasunensis TaxID=397258 RepID=A0ABR8MG46_9ACTN|nr:SDR family oxidoreductase [Nocardioides hwasunensis]MBD3915050.1 SDR family oxidoreductase [Nocardioides hwasunensis]